jgi:hypothetical protein
MIDSYYMQILRAMAAQLKKDVEEGVLQIPEGNKGKKAKQTPKTKGLQEAHQPQELCCGALCDLLEPGKLSSTCRSRARACRGLAATLPGHKKGKILVSVN